MADIVELNRVGSGNGIAKEMAVVFDHGGMAATDYAVAVIDDRVVATVGLLATTLRVGTVSVPVGQPEYIATDPDHQGRGLAGRLLARVEKWSEDRGDLVQVIGGVPYFYRQYGYSYGLVRPPELAVAPEQELAMPAGWHVRAAEAADIHRIHALEQMAQAGADVALPYADNLWPAFLKLPAAPLLVAAKDGELEADRLEADQLEAVRLGADRLEADRLGARRLEADQLEADRLGARRLEADRLGAVARLRLTPAGRSTCRRWPPMTSMPPEPCWPASGAAIRAPR